METTVVVFEREPIGGSTHGVSAVERIVRERYVAQCLLGNGHETQSRATPMDQGEALAPPNVLDDLRQ